MASVELPAGSLMELEGENRGSSCHLIQIADPIDGTRSQLIQIAWIIVSWSGYLEIIFVNSALDTAGFGS